MKYANYSYAKNTKCTSTFYQININLGNLTFNPVTKITLVMSEKFVEILYIAIEYPSEIHNKMYD